MPLCFFPLHCGLHALQQHEVWRGDCRLAVEKLKQIGLDSSPLLPWFVHTALVPVAAVSPLEAVDLVPSAYSATKRTRRSSAVAIPAGLVRHDCPAAPPQARALWAEMQGWPGLLAIRPAVLVEATEHLSLKKGPQWALPGPPDCDPAASMRCRPHCMAPKTVAHSGETHLVARPLHYWLGMLWSRLWSA